MLIASTGSFLKCKSPTHLHGALEVVRMKGLEPPRLTAPDPKSGAAANYATSAFTKLERKDMLFRHKIRYF